MKTPTDLIAQQASQLSVGMKTGIAIMAAFILYLIAKNRLGIYIGLVTG